MRRKATPFIFLLVMALVTWFLVKSKNSGTQGKEKNTTAVNRDRGFVRDPALVSYTRHARCRMECRKITESEVKEIMAGGKINYNKSDLKDPRCPEYALEGRTSDDQRVRIVFGQCNNKTNVITVIDLERDWQCNCPGDGPQKTNR